MYIFKQSDVFEFINFFGKETKQKGKEIFFKNCPYCNGGIHNDSETFSINYETGVFKCFRSSCGKQGHFVELCRDFGYKLQNESVKKFKKLPQKKIESSDSAISYLNKRGISDETARKFKITTRKDNKNVLVFPFYDEQNTLQFVKYRNTKFKNNDNGCKEWCEKDTKPILFGMFQCEDFTSLVITEGQIDSLSLSECGVKNAVSVPTGAQGFTWLQHCWEWINKFDEIIVFGDCENGHITLIDELSKKLQKTVKCVREEDYLCEKDANDILRKYGKEAIITAIKNACIQPISHVRKLSSVESINLNKMPKIKTNIRRLDRTIGGFYMGQVILLSGKRGEGKSTFMSQMVVEALDQNKNVFVYSGELPNAHFKNWIDLQIAGAENIETEINEYGDKEYFIRKEISEKINQWYDDKCYIFDNEVVDDEYDGLLKTIQDSICRYDINLICIDNLMTAIEFDENTDIYRAQSKFVKKLAKMAKQYNVVIILVAHPKKTSEQFNNDTVSGSSDITNAVDVVLNYERKEDGDSQSRLMVTKNRLTGKLLYSDDSIKLSYSDKSKRICETAFIDRKKNCGCFKSEVKDIDELERQIKEMGF